MQTGILRLTACVGQFYAPLLNIFQRIPFHIPAIAWAVVYDMKWLLQDNLIDKHRNENTPPGNSPPADYHQS